MIKVATLVGSAVGTAIVSWLSGSYAVVAGSLAFMFIGIFIGSYIFSRADESILKYYEDMEYDKKRQAWPIGRSLIVGVSGTLTESGTLTVTIRVTNVGPVPWTVMGGTIKQEELLISHGISLLSDLVVGGHNVTIDQGQSTEVRFKGRVHIPAGADIISTQIRYGVVGTMTKVPTIQAFAPELPTMTSDFPIVEHTLSPTGEVWVNRVECAIRVII